MRTLRLLTQTGIKIVFCLSFNPYIGCWFANLFERNHYHNLTPPQQVHYIRSHQKVSKLNMVATSAMYYVDQGVIVPLDT